MSRPSFDGARVVSFESRHDAEMARLIEKQAGLPIRAPSMREVALGDQREALTFAEQLLLGRCEILVLLTGVGLQALLDAMVTRHPLPDLLAALAKTELVCRGPKPVKVLKQYGLTPSLVAPEPNTSRDLLGSIEGALPVAGRAVYVQEYGAPSQSLLDGLAHLGADVHRVGVYRWQLPEDTTPLRDAIARICDGEVDVALFTSAQQVRHLLQVAEEQGKQAALLSALQHVVIGSIGPVTSEALREAQIPVHTEPDHPKMGQLVLHLARHWREYVTTGRPDAE